MQYLLMIHSDEKAMQSAPKDAVGNMLAAYGAYTNAMKQAGVHVGGERLQPSSTGTVVRTNNGKTSVLNCICGIYRANGGRILFGGEEIGRTRPHQIARLGIARTFQHGELFAHLSVIENLLIARHARIATRLLAEGLFLPRVRKAEAEHRRAVEEVLEFTDLERYRHRRVDHG